jgi:hypothetical protein
MVEKIASAASSRLIMDRHDPQRSSRLAGGSGFGGTGRKYAENKDPDKRCDAQKLVHSFSFMSE